MKKLILLFIISFAALQNQAQDKYFTKTGKISFDATTTKSPENIDGVNKSAICVLDTKTGNIQFSVLMKGFEFERALMQEHFNENYVESNKFPKSEFKGSVTNNASVNYTKDGTYPVKVKGNLLIHGVTNVIETDGKIIVKAGKINAVAEFNVSLSDYNISVPSLVADKLAKTAKIKVDCLLEPLK
ncbi:MAG: YceI family protein [Lacibacter sp.]